MAANRAYLSRWGAETGDRPLTYRSGVPHPTLNGVIRVCGLTAAEAYEKARPRLAGVPWVWWAGPDSDPGIADGLVALGARELGRLPIMAVETSEVAPPGLPVEEAADPAEFVAAYAKVSGIPEEGVAAAVERERTFGPDVARLVLRRDGRIAGTAEVWFSHGIATLYFVGTQAEHRRRGIGAAVTRAAVRLAHERGVRTVSLTSSPMGEPLYRSLGFRAVGEYRLLAF
ncbi:acetyltransferase [Paractinoplanes deccanensis]|uniref:Acetyltransferase n=2 Tax=Paractinoplanes deccanensis TaxID=113561 RepID=A0ABQ3Y2Z8_9ACTN|nr:acetyltransferase [Actinoplanes deccanensis]